jgi:hypothetical protein
VRALGAPDQREIAADDVEAGILDRTRTHRRKFRRLEDAEVTQLLSAS